MTNTTVYFIAVVVLSIVVLIQASCQVDYEKVGCFKDLLYPHRRLPELLLTDRDVTVEQYGQKFNWSDFEGSVNSLLCRCSTKARSLGYRYIGIQFYAECWAGNTKAYEDLGPSEDCMQSYKTSDKTSFQVPCNFDLATGCVGLGYTNFVYDLLGEEWSEMRDGCNKVDIALLLDLSSSMKGLGLLNAKDFLKNLIDLAPLSRDGANFGLITFSHTANVEFDFTSSYNDGHHNDALKHLIDNYQSLSSSTWPDTAFKAADEHLFTTAGGMRQDATKIVITITDGSVHHASVIYLIMSKLQTKDVKFMSVAVGHDINQQEMKALAFLNKHNVIQGNDDSAAEAVANKVATMTREKCKNLVSNDVKRKSKER